MYDLRTSKWLDCGCAKQAFQVAADRVALVTTRMPPDRPFLEREEKNLSILRDVGIRVPDTFGIVDVIHKTGVIVPALIEEFIDCAPDRWAGNLEQLRRIADIVRTRRIYISDFQFMTTKTGDVVVHDPYGVSLDAKFEASACVQDIEFWIRRIVEEEERANKTRP